MCRSRKVSCTRFPPSSVATAAALAYAETLRNVGEFDLVLLGLGDDGHTASLFPNHDWGIAPDAPAVLAVFNAPKPPPERVSLSAARLSRAREVLFLIAGESKREAVQRWRAGEDISARAIRPRAGVDVLLESKLLSEARDVNRSAATLPSGLPTCRRSET